MRERGIRGGSRASLAASILLVLLAACGGEDTSAAAPTGTGSPATTSASPTDVEPSCHPDGTKLEIAADGIEFDKTCLAAPADTAFTLTFENRHEAVLHNVTIATTGAGPVETVFETPLFAGVATETYKVDPLEAGIYSFKCSAHPVEMHGQFVVE